MAGSLCFHCFLQGFVRPHIAEGDKYTCQGEKYGVKIQGENSYGEKYMYQGQKSQDEKYGVKNRHLRVKSSRVKIQGENSYGEKYMYQGQKSQGEK